MPQLFTVRWPLFARLEAALFFPVAVVLASESTLVQSMTGAWFAPAMSALGARLGLRDHIVYWGSIATAIFVPYFVSLIVIDRLLTVRKGFAILSLTAVAVWTGIAMKHSKQLAALVPHKFIVATHGLPLAEEATIAAVGVALLLHLRPIFIGLLDEGQVAGRLLFPAGGYADRAWRGNHARRAADEYYSRTTGLSDWRPQRQLQGLRGEPRENAVVKLLWALTWIGVIGAASLAYYKAFGAGVPGESAAIEAPAVAAPVVEASVPPAQKVVVDRMPEVPSPQSRAIRTPPGASNAHAVETVTMPTLQRPTPLPTVIQPSFSGSDPDEAAAERRGDGSFVFDAVVNGAHVPMMFDTGASVVAIRAEDAERLGIDMNRLRYSAKVKTANGTADVAPVVLDTISIGSITQRSVVGFVAREGSLNANLLGQSFLTRLAGFNVESNRLILKSH